MLPSSVIRVHDNEDETKIIQSTNCSQFEVDICMQSAKSIFVNIVCYSVFYVIPYEISSKKS
jgi:hypothetical protein